MLLSKKKIKLKPYEYLPPPLSHSLEQKERRGCLIFIQFRFVPFDKEALQKNIYKKNRKFKKY